MCIEQLQGCIRVAYHIYVCMCLDLCFAITIVAFVVFIVGNVGAAEICHTARFSLALDVIHRRF